VVVTLIRVRGDDADVLTVVGALRLEAWGRLLGPDAAAARFGVDHHDAGAWHCLALDEGAPVAAGRLTVHSDLDDLPESTSFGPYRGQMRVPLGFASRLVVHPAHQGRGHAARIIVDRLVLAAELDLLEVWGETRLHKVHGLTRHGYEPVGPSPDHSVPGEWMILRAPLDPGSHRGSGTARGRPAQRA
jgi:GNAT superfamily N-acetyltransferase